MTDDGCEGLNFADALRGCLACGVLAVNERRTLTAFNAPAEKLTRLHARDLLHEPATALPAAFQQLIQETFATGRPLSSREIFITAADGSQLCLCASTTLTCNPKGRPDGVILVLNDLTAVARLEQNLRQLDRLASIGTLSASMGHEIKNALVAVKTFVDLLLRQNPEAELADIVAREMRRIDSIVSQMLRFAGPAKPTFAPLHLHELLDHSLHLIIHHLEGKKITVHRAFAAVPDLLKGDRYQLQQAFINLFFNALEAMGPDGQLIVATEILPPDAAAPQLPAHRTQPVLRVTVADTGVGVPPENLGRLFEPFFTTKPQGTGLGLPITRRIIQEHSGVITVGSQLNRGTCFNLLLPVTAAGH